ncbi:hypothetical protein [Halalkaliarchaeum sp. AArc-CO]|uniref:hypothetical protein n=2 Tax=unclassified Halalkaliarchaeum TaxID=2678344 RepID=UPI00217DFBF3|nr:hypothetical protein [Halalkaliarchaeum sp. AArc-CO]
MPATVVDSIHVFADCLRQRTVDIGRCANVSTASVHFRQVMILGEVNTSIVFDHATTTGCILEQTVDFLFVIVDGLTWLFASKCDEAITDITVVRDDVEEKRSKLVFGRLIDQGFNIDGLGAV